MIDENKSINAKDIVNNPDVVYQFTALYILVMDMSMTMRFPNFVQAVNLLAEAGWEIGNPTMESSYLVVLCKNPNWKRKQHAD